MAIGDLKTAPTHRLNRVQAFRFVRWLENNRGILENFDISHDQIAEDASKQLGLPISRHMVSSYAMDHLGIRRRAQRTDADFRRGPTKTSAILLAAVHHIQKELGLSGPEVDAVAELAKTWRV